MVSLAVAATDCEALRTSWPQQPVNAWSSLAFVVAGGLIIVRARNDAARFVGAASVVVGFGSVAFHGDHNALSGWLHDWSIAALLVSLIVLVDRRRLPRIGVFALLAGVGVATAIAPGWSEWIHGGLVAALVIGGAIAAKGRAQSAPPTAVVLLAIGGLLAILGRANGVWCAPAGTLQPHAAWHVAAAAAIVAHVAARGWAPTRSDQGDRAKA